MKDIKFITKQALNKLKVRNVKSEVYQRQIQLGKIYIADPEKATVYDQAVATGANLTDPFRTEVLINAELETPFSVGVHRAVGGNHDFPNPGDILCASLAACVDSTLRLIASRLEIELFHLKVIVTAKIDVRGTLIIDRSVPVGFTSMHIAIEVGAKEVSEKTINTLFNATKRSCVVYQTLKKGLPITKELKIIREENT